jgi:hypothetical protein
MGYPNASMENKESDSYGYNEWESYRREAWRRAVTHELEAYDSRGSTVNLIPYSIGLFARGSVYVRLSHAGSDGAKDMATVTYPP